MHPDWSKMSILIADDDDAAHILLAGILNPTGVGIYSAFNGTEAFTSCIEHPDIQLIIMDIKMPEMNGIEATRLIRKYQKTLPIVVYSALRQSEYKHLMKKLNCEEFLLKPVQPELILSTLAKYLDPYTGVKSYYDMFLT